MQMLGENTGVKKIMFHSPQGGGTDVEVAEMNGKAITLRQCVEVYKAQHNYQHTLEQYHFSINAEEVTHMDSPLRYVNGDMLVATLAKVGGSD